MPDSPTQADKPRIAISARLLDAPVRYNGRHKELRQYRNGLAPLVVPLILLMQESPCN
ncbi:hypothetical protein [Pseudomonas chlororaphis]|uniref:hypothetical protein n=1 Tax=Pseudomonas chlororaphis TaxID=587753 RepID=UPI001B308798|nr:hypothetical protein [Pseudomonas chlororaphis]QTT85825.1 hypothetical protein HUT28_06190 [Pseudomonas chlororaphis]